VDPAAVAAGGQAKFWVYDSLLSEYAAMGFEYGYSVERPDALVLWEAQFGDFANGAQTIVDEFISSSEQKWGQRSSVVLLLPHGYEGQGPDHSSARIERYLQLCAEDNMTVAYPSTPASHFHLLRRQAYARPRRPLIVFTPKSMLRLKAASSMPEDFTTGTFRPVLPDSRVLPDGNAVTRVFLCSGKVVWELEAERDKRGDDRTAILRVEQLAPDPRPGAGPRVARLPQRRGGLGAGRAARTRAPGRSWRSTCPSCSPNTARPARCASWPAGPRPPPPPVLTRSTRSSKPHSSRRHSIADPMPRGPAPRPRAGKACVTSS
jgi:2-oxoglutarate decarboxylase